MFQTLYGQMVVTHDVEVHGIQYDSRKITHGDVFVAMKGTGQDGHAYITDAISKGAKVVVLQDDAALSDSYFMHTGVAKVVVPNTRIALAQIAKNFYGKPASRLTMIGVTGTNGKTTTTHLITSVVESGGMKTGLIGTIEYVIGGESFPATHTTPESLELNELLAQMVERDCTAAVMEVSSHALHQHRVEGVPFRIAVFTNLTQDHMDYHGSMEAYFNAKKILFEQLSPESWAIVNLDDPYGRRFLESTRSRTISYGIQVAAADVKATQVSLSMQGTGMTIVHGREETPITSPLIGGFNVSNILAAFSAGIALGIPKSTIRNAIHSMKSVRGRFEPVVSPNGWTAVIDYAHTPDALEKTLGAIKDMRSSATNRGRTITVFGCGGDRDRTKRPKMAHIATTLSDITFITSDNPRHEDPDVIIEETKFGVVPGKEVYTETDRRKAIAKALARAVPGDVVLIAGKGHEDYQIFGDEKIHFSDREVVEEFIRLRA
ncbi:MAG: UDP-N-acetylmuramoyl-L-alanyl-D-glutamate--2,6-diaminopimelate ligase [Ignavibacteria bacterium]|nr:UDP-N-acetylmuramoyl-L-alanyl-D-glutamate--2,6-diaminopimelate ligase [Ignavibacteria bacterium]